jgi:hypothetical protein
MIPKIISVDMEVESARRIDSVVQVWGYVGDYNVAVVFSIEEAIAKGIIPKAMSENQIGSLTFNSLTKGELQWRVALRHDKR